MAVRPHIRTNPENCEVMRSGIMSPTLYLDRYDLDAVYAVEKFHFLTPVVL
jgi:hypothetical protein